MVRFRELEELPQIKHMTPENVKDFSKKPQS